MVRNPRRNVLLLRGAAALFGLLGLALVVWLGDKALRYPEIQARQFGYTAPLWIPAILFVLLGTGCSVYLFWRASRRVQSGEDLFAQRHRRHPDEDDPASGKD